MDIKDKLRKRVRNAFSDSYNKRKASFNETIFFKKMNDVFDEFEYEGTYSKEDLIQILNEFIDELGMPKFRDGKYKLN